MDFGGLADLAVIVAERQGDLMRLRRLAPSASDQEDGLGGAALSSFSGNRSCGVIQPVRFRAMARFMRFFISRTLPGQGWASAACSAAAHGLALADRHKGTSISRCILSWLVSLPQRLVARSPFW